jgi:hypothetical protein
MDYQTAVDDHIRPRSLAFLGSVRDALLPLGIKITDILIEEADTVDLRFQLTAIGLLGRRFICAVELTDTVRFGDAGNGKGVLTLNVEDALTSLSLTTYSAGEAQAYVEPGGADALVSKLDDIDGALPEVITKARLALGI